MVHTLLNKEVKCNLGISEIHGIGVFALRDIEKGELLFEASSEYVEVDFSELEPHVKKVILDRNVFYRDKHFYITHPNKEIEYQVMMNHSDDPNSDGETALRDIKCGEEVTESYAHKDMADISKEHFSFL